MIRVAINGFGRIGRMVAKVIQNHPNIELIAINDLGNTKTLAHLLKYDSVHGLFNGTVTSTDNELIINGKSVKITSEKTPENLPWKALNIDVVIESTGRFLTKETASGHLKAGAKKVILSAPPKTDDITSVVLGINEEVLQQNENIISNASCTTNCLAPLAKVLWDTHNHRGCQSNYSNFS